MKKDAEWLLKEKYAGVETLEYMEDMKQLAAGTPLAYLIGHVPFLGTTLYLDSHPLIPRAETEFWVEKAIAEIRAQGAEREKLLQRGCGAGVALAKASPAPPLHILDLCAGSGAIGIAVLRHIPLSSVDFAEIDHSHHLTILKNLAENRVDRHRAKIMGEDLFENVEGSYDFIFSNPPYIDPTLKERVQTSVALHEPPLALFGGVDGMELITRIIEEAPDFLRPGGTLYLEHEPEQTNLIEEEAKARGYASVTVHKDQYGIDRMSKLSM